MDLHKYGVADLNNWISTYGVAGHNKWSPIFCVAGHYNESLLINM